VRTGKAAAMKELAELRPGYPARRANLARRYGLIPDGQANKSSMSIVPGFPGCR